MLVIITLTTLLIEQLLATEVVWFDLTSGHVYTRSLGNNYHN